MPSYLRTYVRWGRGTPRKPQQRAKARELRTDGMVLQEASPPSWVSLRRVPSTGPRDIELSPEQVHRNLYGPRGPQSPEHIAARAAAVRAAALDRRAGWQQEGRASRSVEGAPPSGRLHAVLGRRGKEQELREAVATPRRRHARVLSCGSSPMCFETEEAKLRDSASMSTLGNGMSDRGDRGSLARRAGPAPLVPPEASQSIRFLLRAAARRRTGSRTASETVRATGSTEIVQHIFGAIQEYAGFDEPRWLG